MIALFRDFDSKLLGGIGIYYNVGSDFILLSGCGVLDSGFVYKSCVHNLFLVECELGHGACSLVMADGKEMTSSINDMTYW